MDSGKFIESILALQKKTRDFAEAGIVTTDTAIRFERVVLKYRDRYLAKIGKVSWDRLVGMFKYVIRLLNKMFETILVQEQRKYNETCDTCIGINNIVETARRQGAL